MDARERDECEEGRIPGVVRVPLSRLHGRFEVAEERDKTGKRIGIRGRISDGQNTSPSSSGWREAALLSAALTLHANRTIQRSFCFVSVARLRSEAIDGRSCRAARVGVPAGVRRLRRYAGAFCSSAFYLQIRTKKRADERTRTADLLITSELLYQLSYAGP